MTRKKSPEVRASGIWKAFYQTPEGKAAIGMLFGDFGFYDTPMGDNNALIRSIGQRDVLVRIATLIGFKPEQAPQDAEDHEDLVTKLMRQTPHV